MSTNPTPHALGPEEGEALWWATVLLTVKATAEQTGGEFFLIEELVPRGTATPLHVHPQDDETFYVLEGELTFYLGDGQTVPASAGSFLHIPKGYFPHAFQVNSETARFLVLTTPRHEQFFALLPNRRDHEPYRRQNRSIWRRFGQRGLSTRWRYLALRRALNPNPNA